MRSTFDKILRGSYDFTTPVAKVWAYMVRVSLFNYAFRPNVGIFSCIVPLGYHSRQFVRLADRCSAAKTRDRHHFL